MDLKKKYHSLSNYLSVFSTPVDAFKFRKLRKNLMKETISPISIRVRGAGNRALLCRPNTSDHGVLWDTFYQKYHIPPCNLREDAIIVDLGANVGYTMVHLAHLYPKAHVYGVEMDIENFRIAKQNIAPFMDRCSIIHSAVWSENGEISYGGVETNAFSIVNNTKNENKKNRIQAKTLDTIFKEFGLSRVDYLKMDIEGAEKFVLQHPENWIKNVKSMKIEIHKPANIDDCMKILEKHGFQCKKDDRHPSCIIAIRNSN